MFKRKRIGTYNMSAVSTFILTGFGRQHCDLGAGLLNELLQVNLPQLLGQLFKLVLHILKKKKKKKPA